MTANETESGQDSGANDLPGQNASQTADKQPSPVDVETIVKDLKTYIDERFERGNQSIKDRRIQQISNQLDDFESQLAEFKKLTKEKGLSEDDALWRMRVEQRLGKQSEEPKPGKQEVSPASVETQALLKQLGLDANSPEVANVLRESEDPASQIIAFANLATSKKATPAPKPASVQPAGGGQTTYTDADAIAERLDTLYKNPTKNRAEIKKLVEQLDGMVEKR